MSGHRREKKRKRNGRRNGLRLANQWKIGAVCPHLNRDLSPAQHPRSSCWICWAELCAEPIELATPAVWRSNADQRYRRFPDVEYLMWKRREAFHRHRLLAAIDIYLGTTLTNAKLSLGLKLMLDMSTELKVGGDEKDISDQSALCQAWNPAAASHELNSWHNRSYQSSYGWHD